MKAKLNPAYLSAYAIVLGGAVIMLMPFWFMFVFATHSDTDILSVPPPMWFGDAFLDNMRLLLGRLPYFWHNLGMSFYVAIATTVLNLFFCSLAGYAFAMFEFKYKEYLFAGVLSTMLLPAFLGMIPSVLIMTGLGWMNEPRALIVPAACGAMGVFMMRQFIGSAIPKELLEAARIDGCGEFGIYWRIVVPLITPAFGTLGLITFIGAWNNFMGPLVIMNDMQMYTVPLALRSLSGTGQVPWGAISAGSAVAVLPLLVLFVITSRRLIEGLTAGAVKA
ncbi:carbohydrate ABC transporter permease [Chitinimonas taiwanensis]|jgi:multiple sugar transport system permease protein|uniref:Carbohydrate ABC transporter membrane protein 2, CUT1 family (TC 3.A.1.1.-) n=1 Tax=Chitinimonas taiwanensis DSM 18899 TaxID=1121279 RepID=A0A1K2HFK7_9NEIS|nr:carbohydrate ABC transporter permease [Chitinimonas taiwanensis]SFZ75461.1 carbohydrate ABC transporter membrane protein 2, CUT1 family (TC 3.A.1.1.-) [Chitinimonas taiwanensis DSM 18899]